MAAETSEANDPGKIEQRVKSVLDELAVPYENIPCDPELADTRDFCSHYGIALNESANAIVVASRKEPPQYCLCLVLATTRLDVNHTVRRLMGTKKLSFASPEQTVKVTGMMVGGVTPFGIPENLPVYVDRRIMECESVVIGGGSRSCKIRLPPKAFERLPQIEVVEGLAFPAGLDEREESRS